MIKICFALLWVILTAGLYVFGNDFGTRVIFFASFIIPLLMVGLAGVAARMVSFSFENPQVCKCGETVDIRIFTKGFRFLVGHVKCRVLWENIFTGEKMEEDLDLASGVSAKFISCGAVRLSAVHFSVADVFGYYSWKVKSLPESKLLVMPMLLNTQIKINPSRKAALDSDEYSMHYSGSDPSETFAIREYMPGDSLKNIHWKLSQKTDNLLVRELGMPVDDRILLLMETSLPENFDKADYGRVSEIAAALYAVSHELVLLGIPHVIGWLDTLPGVYKSKNITDIEDLDAAFSELLESKVTYCNTSTVEMYCRDYDPSHVVVFGFVRGGAYDFGQSAVTMVDSLDFELEI